MCTRIGKLVLEAIAVSAGLSFLKKKEIFEFDVNTIGNEKFRQYAETYLQIGDFVLDKTCGFLEIDLGIETNEQQKERTKIKKPKKVKREYKEVQDEDEDEDEEEEEEEKNEDEDKDYKEEEEEEEEEDNEEELISKVAENDFGDQKKILNN
ncbi:hypothetical protein M0812_10618 [Anaeramoeba flamelloides]|uniref:Uncharacterized protein n=1 Tax=Anaeramoeba flamelloides TaxID=1746091 RepID=A0AAV7ZVY0_9EUKA|nr:hypothetical protein M0812_10618 [Anaeramoeba flamelloides]